MRIAYFTPVSPQRSGISDYSERELIPHLTRHADVDVFIDKNVTPSNKDFKEHFNIYPYTEYDKLKNSYGIVLYNMGNNQLHEYIYNTLLKSPGILILHDIYLHGFHWNISLARGNAERYIDEWRYCYGDRGVQIAKVAIASGNYPEFEYTLTKRIIENSLGVVCHSDFGVSKILEDGANINITKINQPFTISEDLLKLKLRDKGALKIDLGLIGRSPIITSFGFIFAHKRYPILLRAFKRFLNRYPKAALLLVGEDNMDIQRMVSDQGLSGAVVTTGYVPHSRLLDYLAASDFCVNLRYPTAGETSRSVLQVMAAEKPVIVSNVGWFQEIPGRCCLKLDVDSYEEDILVEYMDLLASDEKVREAIGKSALAYVAKEHNPEMIAREFYEFAKGVLNGNEIILEKISAELAGLNIDETDDELISYISERTRGLLHG
jgi:glycosyltransferase involved in cell wall biosynthesis